MTALIPVREGYSLVDGVVVVLDLRAGRCKNSNPSTLDSLEAYRLLQLSENGATVILHPEVNELSCGM